jgi:hypothetical protein
MSKLSILKNVLEVIQESLPVSDSNIDTQVNNEEAKTIDDSAHNMPIMELARDFAKILNDRNFECLDGRAEYHLYTVDHLIELIKNNDEQNTINLFRENKIKSRFEDFELLSVTFSADQGQAEVVCNVRTCIISAEDKYLKGLNKKTNKKNRISAGTPFCTTYTLLVKNEKGTWKIDKFEVSYESKK